MTESLYQHMQQLLPGLELPPAAALRPFFETRSVAKDEILLEEGMPCERIYFVNTGCLYLYYTDKDKKEVIHFALENWWLTDYKTFATAAPAVYALATLEAGEVTSMSRQQYEALQAQYPLLGVYFNKIHERAYGAALLKQKTYATLSKADFYNYFRRTYPAVLQRIPPHIFASYMGVTPEALLALEANFVS